MWKPGQLVTINGRTYRVVRNKSYVLTCYICAFHDCQADNYPCNKCTENVLIDDNSYLQKIYKMSDPDFFDS